MDGVRQIGKIVVQAFQKIPGVSDLFGTDSLSTFELIGGILIILCYVVAVGVIILGLVKWALKRVNSEKDGTDRSKSASYWLIGGLVGGGVLILLPSLILIIGTAMGEIASSTLQ